MQDCKDGIMPVVWENIDGYDEYPDEGRVVFPFASPITEVEAMFSKRNLIFDEDDRCEDIKHSLDEKDKEFDF
jgi:hypothetical protein